MRAADGAAPLGNRGGEKAGLRSLAVVLDRHAPPLTLSLGVNIWDYCMSSQSEVKEIVLIRHKNYNWDRPFDPEDYSSPEAVRMLYENWLQAIIEITELREQMDLLTEQATELDKLNAILRTEIKAYHKRKWLPFSLQLVSVLAAGIGINIVTSSTSNSYGWFFIFLSVILEVIAFVDLKS